MYSNTIVSLLTPTDAQCMHPFSPFSIRIRTINRQLWSAYVRSGRQMYEWFVSSLKVSVPTVWSGFPGTDVSLGLSCAGLCLLPVRRAACRSTKLKCCDRVPGAVSGREMYEWFVSSLKVSIPTVWSGFPGTDVSLGLSCAGLCLLPVRRAACRSTKLKCCDRVPGAVSSDATICATRRSSNGARVSRCSLPTEHATDVLL